MSEAASTGVLPLSAIQRVFALVVKVVGWPAPSSALSAGLLPPVTWIWNCVAFVPGAVTAVPLNS